MTRTKKFIYNLLATVSYQIILIAAGLIIPKILLVEYGSEINGLITSINQFVTYFYVIEAGLSGAAIYALYKPLAENNHKQISGIIVAVRNFYSKAGFIFLGLVVILACTYPLFVSVNSLPTYMVALLVLILGSKGVIEFFTFGKYRAILSADQKNYMISLSSIAYQIFNIIIIVVLAKLRINVIVVYFFSVLSTFIRTVILIWYSKRKFSYIDYKEEPNDKVLDKKWDVFIIQVMQLIQAGAPIIIITILTSLKDVSVYSVFNMVILGLTNLLGVFVSGLSASFGEVIAKKQEDILKKSYREFEYGYYMINAILYSVALVMIMPFVKLYTEGITDANYNQPIIGILFIIGGFLSGLKVPLKTLIVSAGKYKETKISYIIETVIEVVLGSILTFKFGIIGMLVAIIISNIYRVIDLIIYVPQNIINVNCKTTICRIILSMVIVGITYFICVFLNISTNTYYQWIVYSIIIVVISSAITFTLGMLLERKELKNVYGRVKYLIKNRK